ncbi:hypothetical protein OHC33_009690 [Knufia fluminis]|uniref:Uncharacterized protein n=1 Tax=Knufia fluminis TaxID=191047 RepID=A0AAN8I1L9_9EURO|nr:hypothetical protein OHC33_009690 [Knufia fluminis]
MGETSPRAHGRNTTASPFAYPHRSQGEEQEGFASQQSQKNEPTIVYSMFPETNPQAHESDFRLSQDPIFTIPYQQEVLSLDVYEPHRSLIAQDIGYFEPIAAHAKVMNATTEHHQRNIAVRDSLFDIEGDETDGHLTNPSLSECDEMLRELNSPSVLNLIKTIAAMEKPPSKDHVSQHGACALEQSSKIKPVFSDQQAKLLETGILRTGGQPS